MSKPESVDRPGASGLLSVERDERGTAWVRCTANAPCCKKFVDVAGEQCRVYHPDAKVIEEDCSVGYDEKYECPHCRLSWWVECDG